MRILSQTVYDFLLALSSFHLQLLGWDQQQCLALSTHTASRIAFWIWTLLS